MRTGSMNKLTQANCRACGGAGWLYHTPVEPFKVKVYQEGPTAPLPVEKIDCPHCQGRGAQ